MKYLLLLFTLVILNASCYYDNKEDIRPTQTCLTDSMSFANDITPILNVYCGNCHMNGNTFGDVDLNGYDQVIIWVNNGKLIKSIEHQPGASPMPKGADKMPDCTISKVKAWVAQGAQDN